MSLRAVIFDLDGTLLYSIEDIADANNRMLNEFGFPEHPLDKYLGWIGNGARILVEASLPLKEREADTSHFVKRFEYHYRDLIHVKSVLYPKIDKVLDMLTENNIPFSIHTNKPQHLTEILVEELFNKWSFKNVLGQSDRFPRKPDPSGALYLAQQLECTPDQIVFVGDSGVDLQTAKAAGMSFLGVNWGYGQPQNENNDAEIVKSGAEMIAYFKTKIGEI